MSPSLSDTTSILEGLTVGALKDIAAILSGQDESIRGHKADIISQILSIGAPGDIYKYANRLETLVPRKHTWLFNINSNSVKAVDLDRKRKLIQAFKSLVVFRSSGSSNPTSLSVVDFLEDSVRARLYLKLSHQVKTFIWKSISPTQKELKQDWFRHTVVVVVHLHNGIVEIRFNGYKQGQSAPHQERFGYQTLVREAKGIVEKALGTVLWGLHLQEAVSDLTAQSKDVTATRIVIRPSDGGQIVLDTDEGASAKDFSSLMQKVLRVKSDSAEINAAIKDSPQDSVMLLWSNHQLLTRLAFSELGTEILYLWRFADKNEDVLDSVIVEIIKRLKVRVCSAGEISNHVINSDSKEVFRVSDLCRKFQTTPEVVLGELEQLVAGKLLNRCFKLRTTKALHGHKNQWVASLGELPEEVEDEDGMIISPMDLSAIEYGYRK